MDNLIHPSTKEVAPLVISGGLGIVLFTTGLATSSLACLVTGAALGTIAFLGGFYLLIRSYNKQRVNNLDQYIISYPHLGDFSMAQPLFQRTFSSSTNPLVANSFQVKKIKIY